MNGKVWYASAILIASLLALAPVSLGQSPSAMREFADCPGSECPRMVALPSGAWVYEYEVPVSSFAIAKFEITFDQWDACVAHGGCRSNPTPDDEGWGRGTRPVINVSRADALEYTRWLSAHTNEIYRLPTLAEFGYADSQSGWNWPVLGSSSFEEMYAALHDLANFGDTSTWLPTRGGVMFGRDRWLYTAPVGQFPANSFGLFDMMGNVGEWTNDDCSGPTAVASYVPTQCRRPLFAAGGNWSLNQNAMHLIDRGYSETPRSDTTGFRVVRELR